MTAKFFTCCHFAFSVTSSCLPNQKVAIIFVLVAKRHSTLLPDSSLLLLVTKHFVISTMHVKFDLVACEVWHIVAIY